MARDVYPRLIGSGQCFERAKLSQITIGLRVGLENTKVRVRIQKGEHLFKIRAGRKKVELRQVAAMSAEVASAIYAVSGVLKKRNHAF